MFYMFNIILMFYMFNMILMIYMLNHFDVFFALYLLFRELLKAIIETKSLFQQTDVFAILPRAPFITHLKM